MRTTKHCVLVDASDSIDLDRQLRALNLDVPDRGAPGRKLATERWEIAHLLSTLPSSEWAFPLRVVHQDRPDWMLTDGRGQVGVESVEAVSENDAHASVLRNQGHGSDSHFLTRHVPGEPRKSSDDLIKEIKADRMTPGWCGRSASEEDWTIAMAYFIDKKIEAASKDGFERVARNWLLIYNNWNAPGLNASAAGALLAAHTSLAAGLATFERIYVLDCRWLWEYTKQRMRLSALHRL
jgi:hypothetical protein